MGAAINAAYVTDASGYKGWAEAVFVPTTDAEIAEILRKATAEKKPVTITGAGSGLTGARVAQGGWVLSLEKFRKLEISQDKARVGAAVTLWELREAAARTHQFYAPDPTEITASVGGTIATNASGSHSFRYGSTRRHVQALRTVFADGRIVEFRRGDRVDFPVEAVPLPRTTKNTAGLVVQPEMDWIDLLCGSEGTLAVITEAELKLLPIPGDLFTGVIFFRSDAATLDAVEAWRGDESLSMIEYMDSNSLRLLRSRYPDLPAEAEAALLLEVIDGDVELWEGRLRDAGALLEASWFALSGKDRERFRLMRHALPEIVNATMLQRGFMKMGTDYAVPHERSRDMLAYYRKRLPEELGDHFVIYGHIGDSHLHVNMLPATAEEAAAANRLLTEFARHSAELGGTVSAEHGLGKRKAHFLEFQYTPAQLESMMAIKRRLDPGWILGRGTLFPVPAEFAEKSAAPAKNS